MDLVSITLCLCIGNAVAWLMAIYTQAGSRNLLWNVVLGSVGAALFGFALIWALPSYRVAGLLLGGPVCAVLLIFFGQSVRRRFGPAG